MSRFLWWRRLRGGRWYLVLARGAMVPTWTKRPKWFHRVLGSEVL